MLTIVPAPMPDLGPDTAICSSQSVLLDPGAGFSQYLWQDLSTAPSLLATQAGTYHVEVTDGNGCTASDTVEIDSIVTQPVVDLGNDTWNGISEASQGFMTNVKGWFGN